MPHQSSLASYIRQWIQTSQACKDVVCEDGRYISVHVLYGAWNGMYHFTWWRWRGAFGICHKLWGCLCFILFGRWNLTLGYPLIWWWYVSGFPWLAWNVFVSGAVVLNGESWRSSTCASHDWRLSSSIGLQFNSTLQRLKASFALFSHPGLHQTVTPSSSHSNPFYP